jgi:hypothetical protein
MMRSVLLYVHPNTFTTPSTTPVLFPRINLGTAFMVSGVDQPPFCYMSIGYLTRIDAETHACNDPYVLSTQDLLLVFYRGYCRFLFLLHCGYHFGFCLAIWIDVAGVASCLSSRGWKSCGVETWIAKMNVFESSKFGGGKCVA